MFTGALQIRSQIYSVFPEGTLASKLEVRCHALRTCPSSAPLHFRFVLAQLGLTPGTILTPGTSLDVGIIITPATSLTPGIILTSGTSLTPGTALTPGIILTPVIAPFLCRALSLRCFASTMPARWTRWVAT